MVGLNFISSSRIDSRTVASPVSNPDPKQCKIVHQEIHNEHLIAIVHYVGCTNYEGRKLLLFDRGVTSLALWAQGGIDPHFSDDPERIHPIARFEPTEEGWRLARIVAWAR